MRILLVSISLIILTSSLFAQAPLDGRWLDDETWQPRNQHATNENTPGGGGSWPMITDWGEDIRLTYFDDPRAHWPKLAISGDYVYVTWWYLYADIIYFVRSTDGGLNWEDNRRISDLNMWNAAIPNISSSGSNVYVAYRGWITYQGIYFQRSTDYGVSWLPTQALYITARHFGTTPTIISHDNLVYIVFSLHIELDPPGDWDFYSVRSTDYGETWSDTMFVTDTTASGLGPDLAMNNNGFHLIRGKNLSSAVTEILYNRSTDWGNNWSDWIILSHYDTSGSFWPQIAAWGDSNVIVSWTDYKYSPYAWTGDAFICRSTDNGETWTEPVQMTYLHLVKATDISADENGMVFLCYDDSRYGDSEIMGNVSYDGGVTWEGEERLTSAPGTSVDANVLVRDSTVHLSWCDARINPDETVYEVYYKRGDFQTGISEPDLNLPLSGGIVNSYPNPFNSSTTITLSHSKGGDARIGIYDIQGRLIKELKARISQGGDKKAVWDATDNSGRRVSSGIYFARVETPQTVETKKILYLR